MLPLELVKLQNPTYFQVGVVVWITVMYTELFDIQVENDAIDRTWTFERGW